MTIGIDVSRSIDVIQKTGVEKVSDELVRALRAWQESGTRNKESGENIEFVFYTPKFIDWLPKEQQRIFGPRRLWTIIGLSREMLMRKPDVLFVPVHTLPFFCPKRTFRIIHDIASIKEPKLYSLFERTLMRWDIWRSIRLCKKIFVSTEQVKNDLLQYTRTDKDQIVVTGFGYNQKNKKTKEHESKKTEGKKQILYIGRIEEKKNIGNLIEGFNLFAKNFPDYSLILAGKPGRGYHKIQFKIQNSKFKIKEMGYISEEEKWHLLFESICLAHVPYEEGFSFPLLEAFDAQLPVVASDIPALREVGGKSCTYVNPHDPQHIADGIERMVSSQSLQEQCRVCATERLSRFSWGQVSKRIFKYIV